MQNGFIWFLCAFQQAKVVHLKTTAPGGKFKYEVTVLTGSKREAGTSANLYCVLTGDRGETGTIALRDPRMVRFQRSSVDSFLLSAHESLGNLKSLNVWHDNSGRTPSWYLKEVIVRDLTNNTVYYFPSDSWLAVEYNDGNVQRFLSPADSESMKRFRVLFNRAACFTDLHLSLSVFTRPVKSSFTRVQRLTCCLTFLYCTMLLSASYLDAYGPTDSAGTLVALGPIPLSIRGILIGIVSGLILLPVNICAPQVCRSARPKGAKKIATDGRPRPASVDGSDRVKTPPLQKFSYHEPDYEVLGSSQSIGEPSTLDLNPRSVKSSTMGGSSASLYSDCGSTAPLYKEQHCAREVWNASVASEEAGRVGLELGVDVSLNETASEAVKARLLLPHWSSHVVLFLSFAVSCTSAVLVPLYGIQFGNDQAFQWLGSVLIAFVQDAVVCQTLQVLTVGLVFAMIVKKPFDQVAYGECVPNDGENHSESVDVFRCPSSVSDRVFPTGDPLPTGPPCEAELSAARLNRKREIQMKQILWDIVLYVLFLGALCLASYTQRDPQAYFVARSMENIFLGGTYTGYSQKEVTGHNAKRDMSTLVGLISKR